MKILFVGNIRYPGFLNALSESGHEYHIVRHQQKFVLDGLDLKEVNDNLVSEVDKYRPDVLVVFKGWVDSERYIIPDTVSKIRKDYKCTTVYWSVDDPDFVGFFSRYMAGDEVWDIALTCCLASVKLYKNVGVSDPHYFLPAHDTLWPVDDKYTWKNPTAHNSPVVEQDVVDLAIVGNPYWSAGGADLGRAALAVAAIDAGMTVEIWGPSRDIWGTDTRKEYRERTGSEVPFLCGHPSLDKCYKGWLQYDEVWRAWRRAKVSFNNHLRKGGGYPDDYRGYCNDKVFQITGSGACMLMDYQPGVSPDVFTAGLEYVEYNQSLDPNECLESAMILLSELVKHKDMRDEIRLAGQRRCMLEHTWDDRVYQLLKILNEHGVK